MHIKAALFDLDGTLIESWPFIMASFGHVLSTLNMPKEGLTHPKMRHCTLREAYVHLGVLETHRDLATKMHIDFQEKNSHLLRPRQHAHKTMRILSSRMNTAVVSNRLGSSYQLLKYCELFEDIELIVGAEDVSKPKPHPECIFQALDYFGVEPHEAAIIGDTVADIRAGKAIGCYTIAIDGSECIEELREARPDYLISDLEELIPLFTQ